MNAAIIKGRCYRRGEQRQLKRRVTDQLAAQGIEQAAKFAHFLVGIGVHNQLDPFSPLLQSPEAVVILNTAYQWAKVQASIHNISTASDRTAKMIFALKTYARYDTAADTKTPAQITEGIDTVLTLYQNQLNQGVEVIRNYEDALPEILCYPDELNQVWTNLIYNAMQAMNNRGVLMIEVTQQETAIQVGVTDNGEGIPPTATAHIFDPFFTTKPIGEGSGLGLHIVKRIVEKHGGKITVASIPGNTCFTVFLPIE